MPYYSLQYITNAWGDWKTRKYGTTKWFVESTNYSNQDALSDYHKYETAVKPLSTTYNNNTGKLKDVSGENLWYDNKTSSTQTNTFHLEKSHASTFTWGLSEALKIGSEVKVSAGVPDVASASASVNMEIDLSSHQEWTSTSTKTWSNDNAVTVPVKKSVNCHLIIKVQTYHVPFTSSVALTGSVALWFNDKVALGSDPNDKHWLWFLNIDSVFREIIANNVVSTEGYHLEGNSVVATANGVLTGELGISVEVITEEFSLRGWNPTAADVQQDVLDNLKAAAQKKLRDVSSGYLVHLKL